MTIDRRQVLAGGLGFGMGGLGVAAGLSAPNWSGAAGQAGAATGASLVGSAAAAASLDAGQLGVKPDTGKNVSGVLQTAIDAATKTGRQLHLPAGSYLISELQLKSGSHLSGVPGHTILRFSGGDAMLFAYGSQNISLSGLTFDGADKPLPNRPGTGLFAAQDITDLAITDCRFRATPATGIALSKCAGAVTRNTFEHCGDTGLFCEDARGMELSHNLVRNIGDNGIQVWRSQRGRDGTLVINNRIENIAAKSGGSGQNGNGIALFRAEDVIVSGNQIKTCAYSAVRANAASNCQILGNSCHGLGEVALYVEFGSVGAVVNGNLVDGAGTGIIVTNFDKGGRLAVVQGNLLRNLSETNGRGIGVEADAAITGNVIENAAHLGIGIGWGEAAREVTATGNLIRNARIGIGLSADSDGGYLFVANNFISGAKSGGIRPMEYDKPTGPDLTKRGSEAFRNFALYGNVSI